MTFSEMRERDIDIVRSISSQLGQAEQDMASEYILLMEFDKIQTWQAQKMAEVKYGQKVRELQTELAIALSNLQR